jgi:hypothetical protein
MLRCRGDRESAAWAARREDGRAAPAPAPTETAASGARSCSGFTVRSVDENETFLGDEDADVEYSAAAVAACGCCLSRCIIGEGQDAVSQSQCANKRTKQTPNGAMQRNTCSFQLLEQCGGGWES